MSKWFVLVAMIVAAAFSRLIPHPWNFTAIGAMALFGGAYLPSKKLSLLVPILALIVSDLVLGFHNTMVFVYLAFLMIVTLGWNMREERSVLKLASFSLLSSCLFFVISNFGVWFMGGFYSKSFEGLVQCYIAAIPFFENQILGDLFFSSVMFGSYEVIRKVAPKYALNLNQY